ncbi:MAG TPA: hypothetical protein VJ464_07240 [Blastocatellia bacterium]|nr:hypothetical protein [Blastocatellia bacterium]
MKRRKIVIFLFTLMLLDGLAVAAPQQSGPTCRLSRSDRNLKTFDLMVSDGDEAVVSGAFSKNQVEVFRNVLTEAQKFARNEEEVGKQEPKTTRFASESEPGLIVDVTKLDDQSQIFITLTTDMGQLTIEAGTVQRRSKREQGPFFTLLSRMQSLLTTPTPAK